MNKQTTTNDNWVPACGGWVRQGESIRGQRLAIGNRDHYYDFSF
jgi:hypothetical protein